MGKPTCNQPRCRTVASIAGMCSYHHREQRIAVPEPVVPDEPDVPQVVYVPASIPGPYGKYGMTADAYDQLWFTQDGRCGICRREFGDDRKPCIDHDHRTGYVRGILCVACNTGLGHLGDTTSRVRSAYEYMRNADARNKSNPLNVVKPRRKANTRKQKPTAVTCENLQFPTGG